MKTYIYSIASLAAALLASVSCQKAELSDPSDLSGSNVRFTAFAEEAKTRTTMVEETESAHITWLGSDLIDLSDGTNKYSFKVADSDAGKAVAGFTAQETVSDPASLTFAMYPHRGSGEGANASELKYPGAHNADATDKIYAPMLAVLGTPTDDGAGNYDFGKLDFKHVGGFVKVELLNLPAGVKSVVFTALDNVVINGKVTVNHADLTAENLVSKIEDGSWKSGDWNGNSVVTFNLGAATAEGDNQNIYVPLPAGTTFTTSGFSVELKNEAGEVVESKTFPFKKEYTVARARMLRGVKFDCDNRLVTMNICLDVTDHQTYALREYAPTKVMIYKDADGKDAETAKLLEISEPTRFMATAKQTYSIQVLPSDYSNQDFRVVVELKRLVGDLHKLYISKKVTAQTLAQGAILAVDMKDMAVDNANDPSWYKSGDARLTPAVGVAYGDANTYFIQCKNGQTYNGATYTANDNIPDEVVIDYRARGNFFEAEIPEGVTFEWFKLNNKVYTARTDKWGASNADPTAYTITHDPANYTVTVKNIGAYAGAPILLMKKGDKTLWAWSFWNVAADGTSIDPVTVGSYQFASMDIGQPTTNAELWVANKAGSNPDPIYRMTHLYQWGRYAPVLWTSWFAIDGEVFSKTGQQTPGLLAPVSFEKAMDNPIAFVTSATQTEAVDWCSELIPDLWGSSAVEENWDTSKNNNEHGFVVKEGAKSIYDPCPKGWRVPSSSALSAFDANEGSADTSTPGYWHWTAGSLVLPIQGYIQAVKLNSSASDYRVLVNGLTENGKPSAGQGRGMVWGNSRVTSDSQARSFTINDTYFNRAMAKASRACPVRCMVDTDNR